MANTDDPQWLTPEEKDAWTSLISVILILPGKLESSLRRVDLTLFDYLTLSHVSEAPNRRIRMSELAFLANGSLSRMSNVVKRFAEPIASPAHRIPMTGAIRSPRLPISATASSSMRLRSKYARSANSFSIPLPALTNGH